MEEMQYDEMTLEDIFKALKKRWLLIVCILQEKILHL